MRIAIDARCLEEERISGVGVYTLEIIQNLLKKDKKNRYIIFSNAYKELSKSLSFAKKYPNAELKRFRWPNKLLNFFIWYFGWPKLDSLIGGVDIFFAPNINFLTVSKNCKLFTTFHDLSFERFPEFFKRKTRLWHFYFVNPRKIAQKSEKLIAVSESTKNDLEGIYGVKEKKVHVICHGVSDDYKIISRNDPKLLEIQKKYSLPYKFILYLGNIEPRKNIKALIEAHKMLRKNNPRFDGYKLVLAGSISPLCRGIIKEEKENISAIGYIDREDKPFVYNLASIFVYPSFFEGFGLPSLEAMACGTPVIASHNSSIPEVVENAAILVNPNRPEEIGEAMKYLLKDEKLYNIIKERGLRQAKKFDWKKCAEKTLKLLTNCEFFINIQK